MPQRARKLFGLAALAGCWAAAGSASSGLADDFSVSSLPGLQWWASAQSSQLAQNPDGSGAVGSGDPVGSISDLSGHGHNAVMGNAIVSGGDAFRPHLQTNLVGGSPGILFDGAASFSSLESSLFDGAHSLTVAFAIEAANSSPYNQYFFGSNSAAVGFVGYGNPYAAVQLTNGQSIRLPATQGIGVYSNEGTDTTIIMIARFQPDGESDFWENGQLVASSIATAAPPNNTSIQSANTKFLGNINYGAAPTGRQAPSSTATKIYFLEGLAATSPVADAQVSQLYNYLSQRWPGVQDVASSPNLYWQTVTTTNEGHIQGIAIGDGERFVFHTGMVAAYDANWHLLTYNPSLSSGVVPPGTGLHSGDGDFAQGRIFAPLELDLAGGGATIGVYDATKSGLPLIGYKNIATPQHELSSLTVVPTVGAHGIIYATSFEPNIGGDKLWMYDYAGGNVSASNFGNFLGTLQIPSSIVNIQGVAYKAPYFYFSDGYHSAVERVLYQNGMLASQSESVWVAPTTVQGLAFDGANLYQVLQSGSTTESAWMLTSPKFNTISTAGSGFWNFNGDSNYGGNLGFDPVIPNGPGATANFGNGTTNTVKTPTVNITIDGAYTVGSLAFNPTSGTNYNLITDGVPGHGLTLNSGNGGGASVIVSSGNNAISTNLVLADSGGHTFNVSPGSSLGVSGAISESGGSQSLTLTGGGTLILGSTNSFTGGTTINAGMLQTTASGALGSGPLTLNSATGATSALYLGGSETIGSLSATAAPMGAASVNIASGAALNVNQSSNTTFQGTLVTSGTFVKTGSGTLELELAPVMNLGGKIQVSDNGTLRLNVVSGSATIASGVVVQVAGSATLELAGSVPALASTVAPANRAAIVNSSDAPAGVLVTGVHQQVGRIDGSGNVVVNDGSDLAANHIIQNELVIGGTATNPATVTIAASDSSGSPLVEPSWTPAEPSSFILAGSLRPTGSSAGNSPSSASSVGNSPSSANPVLPNGLTSSRVAMSELTGSGGGISLRGDLSTVPEPSAFVLTSLALLPLAAMLRCRDRHGQINR